jgi:hypothetical protein
VRRVRLQRSFPRLTARLLATGLALVAAALPLAGCKEVEEESAAGYEPAKLEEIKNSDLHRVTLTAEAARRAGVETGTARRSGAGVVVPYESLLYDAEGNTYVYKQTKPLSYVREEVQVDRVDGSRVLLDEGPSAGTKLVTVGTAEVYGTELEVAGSH